MPSGICISLIGVALLVSTAAGVDLLDVVLIVEVDVVEKVVESTGDAVTVVKLPVDEAPGVVVDKLSVDEEPGVVVVKLSVEEALGVVVGKLSVDEEPGVAVVGENIDIDVENITYVVEVVVEDVEGIALEDEANVVFKVETVDIGPTAVDDLGVVEVT